MVCEMNAARQHGAERTLGTCVHVGSKRNAAGIVTNKCKCHGAQEFHPVHAIARFEMPRINCGHYYILRKVTIKELGGDCTFVVSCSKAPVCLAALACKRGHRLPGIQS
jgi:hypothetical protein